MYDRLVRPKWMPQCGTHRDVCIMQLCTFYPCVQSHCNSTLGCVRTVHPSICEFVPKDCNDQNEINRHMWYWHVHPLTVMIMMRVWLTTVMHWWLGVVMRLCNDSDACTTDKCYPEDGCVQQKITFNDNDTCTENECNSMTMCYYPSVSCDDKDTCMNDMCIWRLYVRWDNECNSTLGCQSMTDKKNSLLYCILWISFFNDFWGK